MKMDENIKMEEVGGGCSGERVCIWSNSSGPGSYWGLETLKLISFIQKRV